MRAMFPHPRPLLLAATALLCGCSELRPTIVTPELADYRVEWTPQEQGQSQASRLLHSAAGTSTHALRLAGTMESRVHDQHDLTVVVLAGSSWVRLAGKFHGVSPGDIIEIPRGSIYYFENRGAEASEYYEIYYPPYDGRDMRLVKEGGDK
jgi:mannose-6-phosphate isomerase-like protein (cupin superfamily)